MKYIIFLLILTSVKIFSYDFANDLPQNTIFFMTIRNPETLMEEFNKTSTGKFLNSEEFKPNLKRFKKIISLKIYKEENEEKVDTLSKELKDFFFNPIAYTIGYNKFLQISSSIMIKGKNLQQKFETMYHKLYKKEFKKGEMELKKEMIYGIKTNSLYYKGTKLNNIYNNADKKNNKKLLFTYGTIDNKLIITDDKDYFKLLLITIKNKNTPKLSKLHIFFKDFPNYKKLNFYFYTNLAPVIALYNSNKEYKKIINFLSAKEFTTLNAYTVFNDKKNEFQFIMKLNTKRELPEIFKKAIVKNVIIKIPEFIPNNAFEIFAININFKELINYFKKFNKEQAQNAEQLLSSMGLTLNDLSSYIGNQFFSLSFFEPAYKTESKIFIYKFAKPNLLLGVIRKLGNNPLLGVTEKDYLDGKIITSSSKEFTGLALGYKSNWFMIGDLGKVRETMQRMSGKSGSFYNGNFYKKLKEKLKNKSALIYFKNTPTYIYTTLKSLGKNLDKLILKAKDNTEIKTLRITRLILNDLAQKSIKDWEKYFDYTLLRIYNDKKSLIMTTE